jgi:hypothetical protein
MVEGRCVGACFYGPPLAHTSVVNCRHSHREGNRKPRTHEALVVVNRGLVILIGGGGDASRSLGQNDACTPDGNCFL